MLIFDSFPSEAHASAFAIAAEKLGRSATICKTEDDANAIDPFPFRLVPPIVLVTREHNDDPVIELAERHGGRFAGT